MYIKIIYSNGYAGCDEEEYLEVADDMEANRAVNEGMGMYSFFDDDRFLDDDIIEEYGFDEAMENYQQNCYDYSYWEEITKEEYEENI